MSAFKKREMMAFTRFYNRIAQVEEERNIVIYLNAIPYSMQVIALEVKMRTKLGVELFKKLQFMGLLRKW
jgi:hypothetical protein